MNKNCFFKDLCVFVQLLLRSFDNKPIFPVWFQFKQSRIGYETIAYIQETSKIGI